jgi:hypothetical protein
MGCIGMLFKAIFYLIYAIVIIGVFCVVAGLVVMVIGGVGSVAMTIFPVLFLLGLIVVFLQAIFGRKA